MMAGASVEHPAVDVGARRRGEPFEEIGDQLTLQVADHADAQLEIDHRVRTAAEVDGGHRQRVVHRHDEVPGAVDPLSRAERLQRRLAERNADVLDGVMLIDIEIARRFQREIEAAVPGKEFQHVVEEPDAGTDVVAALAVNHQPAANLRFGGASIERGGARFHRICPEPCPRTAISSRAAIAASVCSTMPAVIRIHPGVVGSFERSRT
jgi:hypothetical protein